MAFTAQFAGKCCNCQGGFAPGDQIETQRSRSVGTGSGKRKIRDYAHEACYVSQEQRSGQLVLPGMALVDRERLEREKQK